MLAKIQHIHCGNSNSIEHYNLYQQQRLCLARALVLNPEVLLLDEPTSSLDPEASNAIEALLLTLKSQCTLIIVSHYQGQIQRIADRHIKVLNGRFST